MYRFDDKWRKRLLEDALVAELLDDSLQEAVGAAQAAGVSRPSVFHPVTAEANRKPA